MLQIIDTALRDRGVWGEGKRDEGISGRSAPYLFTQVGIFRALTWPGFFLSTRRGSRVTQPAREKISLAVSQSDRR